MLGFASRSNHLRIAGQVLCTRRSTSILPKHPPSTINRESHPPRKMNTYAPLITGLKHVSPAKDLNPGCLFIARYKNRARNYNTDLWIAVLLPDDFQAAFGLQRPPKGAKPASGEWTTDLDKRVYPAYLPGVNL